MTQHAQKLKRGTNTLEGASTCTHGGFLRLREIIQISVTRGWDISGKVDGKERHLDVRTTDTTSPADNTRQITIFGTFDDCVVGFWEGRLLKQRRHATIREALILWLYVGVLGFRDLKEDGDRILESAEPGECEMTFHWKSKASSQSDNEELIKRWQGLLDLLAKDD